MKNLIAIKKLKSILVSNKKGKNKNADLALTFNAELVTLGFCLTKNAYKHISSLSKKEISDIYSSTIEVCKTLKGSDVKYKPMYPNFPKQVMDTSYLELFLNAITHYWSMGTWSPEYKEIPRMPALEKSTLIDLDVCFDKDIDSVFVKLLQSSSSLSQEDKDIVQWFLDNNDNLKYPSVIPFKETLCMVASHLISNNKSITGVVGSATDVLRIMTHLSGGDVSLAENTKFKTLPRKTRRILLQALERVVNEDDISRHKNKWIRAFHSLHIGDYAHKFSNSFAIANKIRNGVSLNTFNSVVEHELIHGKTEDIVNVLKSRPGDFARRLDHVLRTNLVSSGRRDGKIKVNTSIIDSFINVAPKVSTKVLMQVSAHFNNRGEDRIIFTKGRGNSPIILPKLNKLDKTIEASISFNINDLLVERFSNMKDLGKVWVDPALKMCPIPMQQRSASKGLFTVARGTRLPISDKNTLRFFIYWIGNDIDLTASLHDEDLNFVEQISYTNLKSSKYKACHSGDITRAPNGAAEFIDITMDSASKAARYIVMNVFVYNGPTFAKHKKCYAGWMTKDHPNRGEIFDPKLVEQKIDLTAKSKNAIPVVFDLWEKKAIWCDMAYYSSNKWGGNDIHSNWYRIVDYVRAILNTSNKPNLYDLFNLHAKARGKVVQNREDADFVCSFDGDITPFDVDKINADFVV